MRFSPLLAGLVLGVCACDDGASGTPDPTDASPEMSAPDGATDAAPDAAPIDMQVADAAPPLPDDIAYDGPGSLSTAAGAGRFRFGAATAAAQIEDGLTASDWYIWTLPVADGGLGKSVPIGDAVQGASRAIADIGLMQALADRKSVV